MQPFTERFKGVEENRDQKDMLAPWISLGSYLTEVMSIADKKSTEGKEGREGERKKGRAVSRTESAQHSDAHCPAVL
jgi:hypothetical protein